MMKKILICLLSLCFILGVVGACSKSDKQDLSKTSYVIYEVTVDGNAKKVLKNEKVPLPRLEDTEEKIFVGWESGGKSFDKDTLVNSNLTITSVWRDRNTYSVVFDDIVVTVKEGKTVIMPDNPVRDGYIFDGWFNGNVEFVGTELIYQNLTLVSKWVKAEDNYNYDTMQFVSLGSIGGNKAVKLDASVYRDNQRIHFKYEPEKDFKASAVCIFMVVGDIVGTAKLRTASTFAIWVSVFGEIEVYNYPNNVKTLLISGTNKLYNGIVTSLREKDDKNALYVTVPYSFFGGVNSEFAINETDVIGLSMTADNVDDNSFDVWTSEKFKGVDGKNVVDRNNIKDYVRISPNTDLFDYPNNKVNNIDLIKDCVLWTQEGGESIEPIWTILAKRTSTEMVFVFTTESTLDISKNNGVGVFLQLGERVGATRSEKTICIPMYASGTMTFSNYPSNKKKTINLQGVSVTTEVENDITTVKGVVPYASLIAYETVTAEDDIGVSFTVDCGSSWEVWKYSTILGKDGTAEVRRDNPWDYLVWDKNGNLSEYDVTEEDFNARVKNITGDTERVFFDNMAEFSVDSSTTIQTIKDNAVVFTDRKTKFFFDKQVANAIWGKKFTYSTIEKGPTVTVTKSGYMLMVLPDNYSSINAKAVKDGWKVTLSKFNTTATLKDAFTYYVKWCEEGETFSYGKWNFFVTK